MIMMEDGLNVNTFIWTFFYLTLVNFIACASYYIYLKYGKDNKDKDLFKDMEWSMIGFGGGFALMLIIKFIEYKVIDSYQWR